MGLRAQEPSLGPSPMINLRFSPTCTLGASAAPPTSRPTPELQPPPPPPLTSTVLLNTPILLECCGGASESPPFCTHPTASPQSGSALTPRPPDSLPPSADGTPFPNLQVPQLSAEACLSCCDWCWGSSCDPCPARMSAPPTPWAPAICPGFCSSHCRTRQPSPVATLPRLPAPHPRLTPGGSTSPPATSRAHSHVG